MKKLNAFIMMAVMVLGSAIVRAEDPRVKNLLQEALKLYGDHQYVRALDLFKQAQALDPTNVTAEEYIKNTKQRILEWELQGNETPGEKKQSTNWDNLSPTNISNETATNSRDIIAARKSLVDRMKNRSTNTDNIVQIEQSGRGLDVTLFHDQLFLPGLTTLRDEALPILQNVIDLVRTGGDKEILVRTATHTETGEPVMLYPEFALPARDPAEAGKADTNYAFQDLESTRALILFTYLAQKSMGQAPGAAVE